MDTFSRRMRVALDGGPDLRPPRSLPRWLDDVEWEERTYPADYDDRDEWKGSCKP